LHEVHTTKKNIIDNFGIIFNLGKGGPIDTIKATELLRAAADQGLPSALEKLQMVLRSGTLGAQSMHSSSKIVKDKAEKEDKEAIFLLGMNYLNGTGGFMKNQDRAEKLLRKASEMSHPEADLALGKLLLDLANNVEAFKFVQKAAELTEDAEAQWQLGKN
jgi:TPR repeat protein